MGRIADDWKNIPDYAREVWVNIAKTLSNEEMKAKLVVDIDKIVKLADLKVGNIGGNYEKYKKHPPINQRATREENFKEVRAFFN